jgi:hypothetical protein
VPALSCLWVFCRAEEGGLSLSVRSLSVRPSLSCRGGLSLSVRSVVPRRPVPVRPLRPLSLLGRRGGVEEACPFLGSFLATWSRSLDASTTSKIPGRGRGLGNLVRIGTPPTAMAPVSPGTGASSTGRISPIIHTRFMIVSHRSPMMCGGESCSPIYSAKPFLGFSRGR